MNETLEQLLWQQVDGELSAGDRRRLEALLAERRDGRELEAELAELAKLLERVGRSEAEVPSRLLPTVMNQVRARRVQPSVSWTTRVANAARTVVNMITLDSGDPLRKENLMSRKRLALLGALAVAAVGAIALLVVSDGFPPNSETTGAIGGVEKAARYRDAQVKPEDVRVYDSEGYDQDGFDRDGFDRDGIDRDGNHRDLAGQDKSAVGGGAGQDKGLVNRQAQDQGLVNRQGQDQGLVNRQGQDQGLVNRQGQDQGLVNRQGQDKGAVGGGAGQDRGLNARSN